MLLLAVAAPAGAAELTTYTTDTEFVAALGGPYTTETFDGFDSGTTINDQIDGLLFSNGGELYTDIVAVSSPAAVSTPNLLSGGYPGQAPFGTPQLIQIFFSPAIEAVGFFVAAQAPDASAVSVEFFFSDESSQTVMVSDTDENEDTGEFIGGISDTPITSILITSGLEGFGEGGFEEMGIDNLIRPQEEGVEPPPLCSGTPASVEGILGIDGEASDSGEFNSGIASVVLQSGSVNLALSVDPEFEPGASTVAFRIEPLEGAEDGQGVVVVTDLADLTCFLPITLRALPPGPTEEELICSGTGVILTVSNPLVSPGGPAACAAQLPAPDDPALPPGYEPSPEEDPAPCTVMTIQSPISGTTQMTYKKDGAFEPRLRLLFSKFNGSTFPPFTDITESVDEIATIIPDPTRADGKGTWSQVKVACATLNERCNGLDDDGDGLTDEGLPVGGPPVDADGDGALLCAAAAADSDCNDQIAAIKPGAPETCNGMDDNCDGTADEGAPAGGADCIVVGPLGACAAGETSCEEGPLVCEQVVFPSTEVCNGADDDCDGATDDAYVFGDYEQPVNPDGSSIFKRGRTIPFKFRLYDCAGDPVSTAVARIQIFFLSNGIIGSEVEDIESAGQANSGNLYRVTEDGHYLYNLSTLSLARNASYLVRTTLDDGSHYDVAISIR